MVKNTTDNQKQRCLLSAGEAIDPPLSRMAASLPADLLRDDEVVILLLRPNPLFILLSPMASVLMIVLFTMILAYMARTILWIPWKDSQVFAAGGTFVMARLAWQTLEWYSRIYVLTDRRLIRRVGVLRVSVFEAPLAHIQHTSVFVRLRERLTGLGTIGFATSGSDSYEAFWTMISKPFAVHKIITESIQRYGRPRNGH
ncbi:MAG: PH domain-containing protein [Phycisphaerales bacterium]